MHILCTNIVVLICFLAIHYSDYTSAQEEEESQVWKKGDVIYYGEKYVKEGDKIEISCQMSRFRAPKWTLNELPVRESTRISFTNRVGIEMTRIETIFVMNATANDSGFYRCNSFSRNYHRLDVIVSQPIASTVDPITEPNVEWEEIREEYSTVTLKCLTSTQTDNSEVFWFKNSVKIVSDDRRAIQKGNLIIKNATSAVDAGDYLCRVDSLSSAGGSQFGQMIQLRAPIRVKPLPRGFSMTKGERRVIKCDYTGYPVGKIRWLIGNQKVSLDLLDRLGIQIKAAPNSHPDSLLIIQNATHLNTNSYTCIVNNRYSEDETSVYLTVRDSQISTASPILLMENKPLRLVCNRTKNSDLIVVQWRWFKEDKPYDQFEEEDKQRITIDPKDGSLYFSKANKNDIGTWKCQDPSDMETMKIMVRSKPWMYAFEEFQKTNYKSANIIEGQKFFLKCEVMEGYQIDAHIEWFMFNEEDYPNINKELRPLKSVSMNTTPESHIRVERVNATLQTLTIDKVVPTDRYYYVCIADNGVATVNNTILLRVKDKLGALWPFLGIVAEVVILCTIIFIYEKRRIKPDFDDSDDNNTEPKASQDRSSKAQDVRQRK